MLGSAHTTGWNLSDWHKLCCLARIQRLLLHVFRTELANVFRQRYVDVFLVSSCRKHFYIAQSILWWSAIIVDLVQNITLFHLKMLEMHTLIMRGSDCGKIWSARTIKDMHVATPAYRQALHQLLKSCGYRVVDWSDTFSALLTLISRTKYRHCRDTCCRVQSKLTGQCTSSHHELRLFP